MRRSLIATIAALAFVVAAAPANAQTQDKPTEPAPPVADIGRGAIEITKTGLAVNGEPVEAAPPGVEVALTLTFRNTGTETLKDATVTLAGQPDGVRLTDTQASLGDLAAGESADGEFAFIVEGDCFEFVGLGGEAVYQGGAVALKVALPVACPGPRLALGSVAFVGGDGDEIPEPGETLRVTFELVNQGKDTATHVRASVKISGDGLSAAGTELEWPDIEPGGSARNTASLILTVSSDTKRQVSCGVLPQPLPIHEDPGIATDDKALPPDGAVSSDDRVSSGGSRGSDGVPGSAPGSEPAGGGEPSSTGQTEPSSTGSGGSTTEEPPTSVEPLPVQIAPAPGTPDGTEPGTIEPEPAPPDQTVEPIPLPAPLEPRPNPGPAEDQPVMIQALITVTATGYETAAEWSNQTFCAFERGGPVVDVALAAKGARDDATTRGSAAFPGTIALGVSALAALAHRRFVG